jgi:hypothetical protein
MRTICVWRIWLSYALSFAGSATCAGSVLASAKANSKARERQTLFLKVHWKYIIYYGKGNMEITVSDWWGQAHEVRSPHSSLLPPTIFTVKLQVLFPLFSCILYFIPPTSQFWCTWPLVTLSDLISDNVHGFLSLDLTFLTFVALLECMSPLPFWFTKLTLK